MSSTLLLENLPPQLCKDDLVQIFASIGEVVQVGTQRRWGDTLQHGYVTMRDNHAAARAAVVLDGHALCGQPMVVRHVVGMVGADANRTPSWVQ